MTKQNYNSKQWRNYLNDFTEEEAQILDNKYNAQGKIMKVWRSLK